MQHGFTFFFYTLHPLPRFLFLSGELAFFSFSFLSNSSDDHKGRRHQYSYIKNKDKAEK